MMKRLKPPRLRATMIAGALGAVGGAAGDGACGLGAGVRAGAN
jgi:hypothetical protein